MRRRTPGVLTAPAFEADRPEAAREVERIIRILEPIATERRCARLWRVIDDRLLSVQVLFDAPHDPHNGAAVLRSCEAFGVQRLHVVERVERFLVAGSVSRGAEKWVDVLHHPNVAHAREALGPDVELIGAHPDGTVEPAELTGIPNLVLVLGNERDGITADLAAACSRFVRVPMRGFFESLNVSVTAAILLHHATRGRRGDLPRAERRRLYARGLFISVQNAAEILAETRYAQ
jgi:tRNA (guanosine-2'-O-)-methyltransferase